MGFSRWRRELLATRGERLALFRYVVEREDAAAGPAVVEYVGLVEVDVDGSRRRLVAFDPDDLDAGWAELDARFAAGEGAPHAAFLANLRAFVQAVDARDDDTLRRLVPDDLTVSDHRRLVGTEGPVGRDEWLASFRDPTELGELLMRLRVDHIPRLSATAGVIVVTMHGMLGGGAFERPAVVVAAHGGGRPRSLEEFDLEQLDAAFARYEELSTGPRATARIENAATRGSRRVVEAWQARDWERLERLTGLFPVGFRHSDRRRLIRLELDRDEWLAWNRELFEITTGLAWEVLATRGERLAMLRFRWEGADRSIGPSELESLAVVEVDGQGDALAIVEFDPDDLDAAYAELDERYAAGEAAPFAAVTTGARAFAAAVAARDWDALAALLAPDLVVYDHRPLGWEALHGPALLVDTWKSLVELAPDVRLRIDHVTVSASASLAVLTLLGTHEGGEFEDARVIVHGYDGNGRIRRHDIYNHDQLDEARARFAAIGASSEAVSRDPLAALARPNAATATMDRVQAAFEARDWGAVRALAVEGAVFEDRRRHALLSGDRDWLVANLKLELYDSGLGHFERRLVATAGDRVCVHRGLWTGGGPAGGRAEIEYLWLAEVDEKGRITFGAAFDLDDWRAASREGWTRWLARDAEAAAVMRPIFELVEGANDHNRSRMRAVFADDLAVHDHRRTGEGRVDGADAYLDTFAVVRHLVPDMQLEPRFVLALERHGVVAVSRLFGTLPEGGAFEIYVMDVATVARGRVTRLEFFEIEALDAALARLAELRPDPLRMPPNAATRTADRHMEALQVGDMEALSLLCTPTMIFDDRRRGVLLCGDRDMFLASSRISAAARLSRTLLATAGDRLILEHLRWSGGAGGQDFEIENLSIHEVDAEGRTTAVIAFDPDDRRAASRELFERHARSEAGGSVPAAALELWRAFLDRDLERCRGAIPADFVYHDHRRSGPGRIEGADAWMAWNATLLEQSPDVISEPLYYLASEEHGSLAMGHTFGTLAGGRAFESVYLSLWLYRGGLPAALERFEPEDLDLARARLEELRPSST